MLHTTLAGFFNEFGFIQALLLLFVGLLIFGGKKLPEMGRSLGKGIVEFKKGLAGIEEEGNKPVTSPNAALPANQAHSALPQPSTSVEEELRSTREQLRQLSEELKATQAQLRQQAQKPPTA